MWVEPLITMTVRLPEGKKQLKAEQPIELPDDLAAKLLERAPGKVRTIISSNISLREVPIDSPMPRQKEQNPHLPVSPGWLIAYCDEKGRLRGGCEEREHGTIREGRFSEMAWIFTLTDGTEVPAKTIVSVAKVMPDGRIVAAWTVRDHGLDGSKAIFP